MKIALVSPYDFSVPGGVNGHILQLATQFRKLGHQVRILTPASDESHIVGEGVIVVGRPIPVHFSGSVARIAWNPRLGGRITEILEHERFDVVHLHEPLMPGVTLVTLAALRASTAITVGTFHAAKEGGTRLYSYGRRFVQRWFSRLDGRIAVSPAAAQLIERYFPATFTIIPNGINVAHYATDAPPYARYRDGKINLLFLGRLEQRKGLKYLLRAYAGLKREYPNIRLIVVGEGGYRRGYQTSVQKAGLADVVFAGLVTEEEKLRYLHTADIFCAPNTGNESFGIVLAEAMAAGLPIVASNVTGFAYVVTHGEEALLVRPRDERALGEALRTLILDPGLRHRLAERGRVRVNQFDWSHVAQDILSYYERLLYERESGRLAPLPEDQRSPLIITRTHR